MSNELRSWRNTPTRRAITDFVAAVTKKNGPSYVPVDERIAVFDNDGTLWTEKPMPVELGFILQRFARMAEADPALRNKQPWKAAYQRDYAWLGGALEKHYRGDESDVELLIGGLLKAFEGVAIDEYETSASAFLRGGKHPTLGRPFTECGYVPMVELLRYLEAHEFSTYIASGGNRDFMRPITDQMYGIPPERVIGSSSGLAYTDDETGGSISYLAEPDVFDDGPVKPVRIWSRVGRRPILAAGNSNGDVPMLSWAGGPERPALRLLILHDDAEREFEYEKGAEAALARARDNNWTVVSMRDDWSTVFAAPR